MRNFSFSQTLRRIDFISILLCESWMRKCAAAGHMAIYGYARVSTDGQTVAAQVAELQNAGATKVFSETASGAKTDRAQLSKVLRVLQPGDTLMVTRLDR